MRVETLNCQLPFANCQSELQACLPSALGESFDSPVIEMASAVEHYASVAQPYSFLGEDLPNGSARRHLAPPISKRTPDLVRGGTCCCQSPPSRIINKLHLDMLQTSVNHEPWPSRGPVHFLPNSTVSSRPSHAPPTAWIFRHSLILSSSRLSAGGAHPRTECLCPCMVLVF
jgi:hypothetical protein